MLKNIPQELDVDEVSRCKKSSSKSEVTGIIWDIMGIQRDNSVGLMI